MRPACPPLALQGRFGRTRLRRAGEFNRRAFITCAAGPTDPPEERVLRIRFAGGMNSDHTLEAGAAQAQAQAPATLTQGAKLLDN